MISTKRYVFIISAIIFLTYALPGLAGAAVEFSADMTEKKDGMTSSGKIYVKEKKYRWEKSTNKQKVIVIVDKEKKVTNILNPKEKKYLRLQEGDIRCLSNDPFQTAGYVVDKYITKTIKYKTKTLGNESVEGFVCQKLETYNQGYKIMTQWVSDELAFPIKIIIHQDEKETIIKLSNIKKETLQDKLFSIPSSFTQMEDPYLAVKRKEAAMEKNETNLPALVSLKNETVPCMVKIGTGGELRVPLDSERWTEVDVVNISSVKSIVIVVPYYNGRAVETIGVSPSVLKKKGERKKLNFNDPLFANSGAFKVDEVRIIGDKGLIYATISQWNRLRKDFYNKGNHQSGKIVSPDKGLTVKITDDNPFGSKTEGYFLVQSNIKSKSKKVNFVIENKKTRVWKYPASHKIFRFDIMIGMGDGRVKISLIQPK